jgi:uncharacterized LabA/DUF88 family protein
MEHTNCYVYVDNWYMRQQLRDLPGSEAGFNPLNLAGFASAFRFRGRYCQPTRYFVYDAIDESEDEAAQLRQRTYLTKVQRLPDTQVVTGRVKTSRRGREQKGVDVRLAVDALEAAWSGVVDAVMIASGDADFEPLADAIRRAGPHVGILAFKSSLSLHLREAADRVYELPEDHPNWFYWPSEYAPNV